MTREDAKQLLPIIKAYAEGKEIEIFDETKRMWITAILPLFNCDSSSYRIKPEPKYRPFANAEECWTEMLKHQPFGWVKAIPDKEYNAKYYPNNKDVTVYYQVQKVAPGYIKYDDANDRCDYIPISVKKGTKIHNILEKSLPLKGVECFYGTAVWYKVPKSEFEKEEL